MSRWKALEHYERNFDKLTRQELLEWRDLWMWRAANDAPMHRKGFMKQVHRIDRSLHLMERDID